MKTYKVYFSGQIEVHADSRQKAEDMFLGRDTDILTDKYINNKILENIDVTYISNGKKLAEIPF